MVVSTIQNREIYLKYFGVLVASSICVQAILWLISDFSSPLRTILKSV